MDIILAKQRYDEQKYRAKARGIEFLLTFDAWYDIWQQSGKWEQRGRGNGKYVMSRYGDIGPYAVGNVQIVIHRDNVAEMLYRRNADPAFKLKTIENFKKPKSENHCRKISDSKKGVRRIRASCIYCHAEQSVSNLKAQHWLKCNTK